MNDTLPASAEQSPKQILIDSCCRNFRSSSIAGGFGCSGSALLLLALKSDIPAIVPILFFVAIVAVFPLALQCWYAKQLERLRHLLEHPDQIAWVFRGPFPRSCREVSPWPWRLLWEKIPAGDYLFEIRTSDGTTLRSSVPRDRADDVAAWLREIAPSAFPPSAVPATKGINP